MKYNIIGDIHGRDSWRNIVIEGAVNIFVGDYFSPYHPIPWIDQLDNFLQIIEYKQKHPSTILLIGNHDEDHWHFLKSEYECTRHDEEHEQKISILFEKYKNLFQAAYSIENKVLVTHAGVTSCWYGYHFCGVDFGTDISPEERRSLTPDIVAEKVNKLWHNDPVKGFGFIHNCCNSDDYYGYSRTHGPMWARWDQAMKLWSIFRGTDYIQVYGHTISDDIMYHEDVVMEGGRPRALGTGVQYMVDCLEEKDKSLLIETDNNSKIIQISHHENV